MASDDFFFFLLHPGPRDPSICLPGEKMQKERIKRLIFTLRDENQELYNLSSWRLKFKCLPPDSYGPNSKYTQSVAISIHKE